MRTAPLAWIAVFPTLAVSFIGCGGYSTSPSTPTIPTSTPSVMPSGAGGTINFTIPTPAPIACKPTPVTITVGESVNINCTAPDYVGPFTWSIANSAIASIEPNNETFTYFSVTGLNNGTTTFSLQDQLGGSGADTITVSP